MAHVDIFSVIVCLAVLFMQRRDERRARALQSDVSDTDSVAEQLDDDLDSKGNISVEHVSVAT